MTSTTQDTLQPSQRAAFKKMQEISLRVQTANTANDLWVKVFSPQERARLGDDLEVAYRRGGPVRMWATVYGCSDVRAVIDMAHKLNHLNSGDREWLLKEADELLDAEEAFEYAIANNELVLNSQTREVYWNGDLIEIDWFRFDANWTFVWELARHAKAGRPVDSFTFGGNRNPNHVSRMKSQIIEKRFPLGLADLIELAGAGTQILRVAPEQIRLFESHIAGEIREWTP